MYYQVVSKTQAPYDARVVANTFIRIAAETNEQLTNMKLIKLVYIAHGWYLGITGTPLIAEKAQAWTYGPVIPSVYGAWQSFRGEPIDRYHFFFNPDTEEMEVATVENDADFRFLRQIWDGYGRFNAAQLSAMTHLEGTPWDAVWKARQKDGQISVIEDEDIAEYYRRLKVNRERRLAHSPTRRGEQWT